MAVEGAEERGADGNGELLTLGFIGSAVPGCVTAELERGMFELGGIVGSGLVVEGPIGVTTVDGGAAGSELDGGAAKPGLLV